MCSFQRNKVIVLIVFLVNLLLIIQSTEAATTKYRRNWNENILQQQQRRHNEEIQGRLFYDALSSFISTSEWFPFELNVPDTISAVASGASSLWSTMIEAAAQSENIPRIIWRSVESIV